MTTVTQVNARILELVEKGYESSQILAILKEEQELREDPHRLDGEEEGEKETFPDAIRLIAQALAFRDAVDEDVEEVLKLLQDAYQCDIEGEEAFIDSKDSLITKESILYYMSDTSYRLKVLEVPQGHGIERDGIIIGVTCFSTDGESRRNGVVEGTLASVRWLAVLPKYKHLLVGSRLLLKVEEEARRANCYRIMLCVASTRTSVIKWLERRDYFMGRSLPFPSLSPGHSLISEDTCLLAYLKELGSGAEKQMKLDEDPKRKHLSPIWRMSRPS